VPEEAWTRDTWACGTANIPNGVVVAQVGLGGEGEVLEVGQLLAVRRVDPGRVEGGPVVGHVGVGVGQGPAQALELERPQLVR
jgi:hypothetical protein